MRQFLFYNLARLGILIVVAAIIIGIFKWSLIAAVASIVISALLSYLLLGRLREGMNETVADKVEQRRERKAAQQAAGMDTVKGEWADATKRDQRKRGKAELEEDALLDAEEDTRQDKPDGTSEGKSESE